MNKQKLLYPLLHPVKDKGSSATTKQAGSSRKGASGSCLYTTCVMQEEGGPIQKIEHMQMDTASGCVHEAVAYLDTAYKSAERSKRHKNRVYGNGGDGAGADPSLEIALNKAVSEAFERWAHRESYHLAKAEYGYDINPTTNGMSATPKGNLKAAEEHAWDEALERHLLMLFWEEKLRALPISEKNNIHTYLISHPNIAGFCIVLEKEIADGRYAYSFSGGHEYSTVYRKACVELKRTETALTMFYQSGADADAYIHSNEGCSLEKRALYFSTLKGHQHFREKIEHPPKIETSETAANIVFDGELKGEWSQWAHVWRTVIRPPSERAYDASTYDYFWW